MDVTEQVDGGRGLGRGNRTRQAMPFQLTSCHSGRYSIVCSHTSFVKSESITETQWLFRRRFNIGRLGNIPSRNTILRWVTSFWARGTIMKKKPPDPVATARTPEHVESERPSWGVQPVLLSDTLSNWEWAKARYGESYTKIWDSILQNDGCTGVKQRGLTTFSLCRANAQNYPRKCGRDYHDEWSTFPPKQFSKQTELQILGPTKSPWSAWETIAQPKSDSLVCYW